MRIRLSCDSCAWNLRIDLTDELIGWLQSGKNIEAACPNCRGKYSFGKELLLYEKTCRYWRYLLNHRDIVGEVLYEIGRARALDARRRL